MHARRWILFAVVAIGFFAVALNGDAYNLTSPPVLSWHVALRKFYSLVAFAVVGATFARASGASLQTTAIVVALYSGLIEIGQNVPHRVESLIWNGVDVVCGAVGGALGTLMPWVRAR